MIPLLQKVWDEYIPPHIRRYVRVWDILGGAWLSELSGSILTELEYDRCESKMSQYREFNELSGEEQIAFVMWVVRLIEDAKKGRNFAEIKAIVCDGCARSDYCKRFSSNEIVLNYIYKFGVCPDR